MPSFLIALMFAAGVGAYAWSYMARSSGNASAGRTAVAAGVVGLIAFIFFFSLLKWVLHL